MVVRPVSNIWGKFVFFHYPMYTKLSKVLLNITTHQSSYIKKYSMIMKSDLCICQLLFLELKSSQQSAYSWVLIVFYLFIVTLSCLWKRQPINLSREIVLQLTPQYVQYQLILNNEFSFWIVIKSLARNSCGKLTIRLIFKISYFLPFEREGKMVLNPCVIVSRFTLKVQIKREYDYANSIKVEEI